MNTKHPVLKLGPALLTVTAALLLGVWLLAFAQSGSSVSDTSSIFYSPVAPVGGPQIRLTKTVNNNNPAVGDEITYTLSYATVNPGAQAFNVRLYEFLPAGVQFVSSNPPASFSRNGAFVFEQPSIGPTTDPVEVTMRVRVLEGFEQLYDYSLVMADGVVPPQVLLTTDVTQPASSLRLLNTGYSAVLVNDELVYTLMCQNTGDAAVDNVTLINVLPSGLPLVGASPPPDDVAMPVLTWSLGVMAPRERRTVVITTTAPAYTGVITNTALVDARQRVVSHTLFATQVVSQGAVLRVSKTGSASLVGIGDELVYTLRYENAGNQAAAGVTLTDTFPSGLDVLAADPPAVSLTDAQGVWRPGSLASGSGGQVVITTTVQGAWGRTLLNTADITGDPGSFPEHAELETDVRSAAIYVPILIRH